MTKNRYRTAQGKTLDMGALILQNENVRAVGNMQVNARGDRLNADNKTIQSRRAQMTHKYDHQVAKAGQVHSTQPAVEEQKISAPPPPPEDFDDDFEKPQSESAPQPTGLAGAMARVKNAGDGK